MNYAEYKKELIKLNGMGNGDYVLGIMRGIITAASHDRSLPTEDYCDLVDIYYDLVQSE